jgi:hypothetical protein
MATNKAKLFISNHPGDLLLYENFVKIIRRYDKKINIILFKVNHPYFLKFDFEPHKKYFDEIIDFDFIHYKKNIFLGYWEIFKFQRKLKMISNKLLKNFERIDLFSAVSAWLPLNILLYNLSKNKNIKSITRFILCQIESPQIKTDKTKTFFCRLYTLPFGCYKIKVLSTLKGKFVDFVYDDNLPGDVVKITSFTEENLGKEDILPYPIISNAFSGDREDMVIIFGDESIFWDCSEYLPQYEIYAEKITNFFQALEKKYSDCRLYYKPHPCDKEGKFMPGINPPKYTLFDNKVNAQTIFDSYYNRIKAVYTLSSSSVISSSFFGIPSYTFYHYLVNQAGREKFDNMFSQDNIKSKFLFHLSDLKEIGKIDNLKRPKAFNLDEIGDKYYKLLKLCF